MKDQKTITDRGRPFNGEYHPKIKRIRTDPRQRIRLLLRSFDSINLPEWQFNAEQNSSDD